LRLGNQLGMAHWEVGGPALRGADDSGRRHSVPATGGGGGASSALPETALQCSFRDRVWRGSQRA
jgi:hypothetical protein